MKNRISRVGPVILIIFKFVINAGGEETKPASGADEIKKIMEGIKNYLGLSLYLQGGYTFNFKNPDSRTNEQRILDRKANSFLIDLAQIHFAKEAPAGGVGYKLKVSIGETAKSIHSAGLGEANDEVDLTEAYVDYIMPIGGGLKLRFGKFATYHGAELIEAKENFNYSRSFLFNFAIPFTHTGFMAGYTFSDAFSANLYIVNGWDVTNDNNKAKTIGTNFVMTPIGPLSMNIGFMFGPEQEDNSSHERFLFDWVGTFKGVKDLTLVLNTDYGREEKDPLNTGKNSKWYGIAGYMKYEFNDSFSTSFRAEYFVDKNGVRTGIPQVLKEITITPEFKITKNLLVRPEYRHDWSNKKSFDSHHNTFDKKSQDTISIGVMYTW